MIAFITVRPDGRNVPDHFTVPADPAGLDLQFRVATSVLDEFALSHTPADVLRELVQNEYDAGGTELVIDLDQEKLVVRGNGRTIDKAGWKRLSVMLGHGQISGAADRVESKVNGIGSKNFGLRSLFLIGDRIHVMSGGQRTILDRTKGTPPTPLAHPDSGGQPGVTLVVPYRQADDGRMRAFDQQHEADALGTIAAELAPTLIKLAHPGPGKNLRTLLLRSARLGRELRWRQSARADKSVPGLIRRTARLDEGGSPLAGAPQVITEMEYQRAVAPPAGLPWPDVPGYFRVPAGRIRLGVSLRTRRGRIDLDTPGIFYYPIGASRSRTGFVFSVSAPFEMNENRDQLVDPQNSDWNEWLIQQAAAFAIGLLPQRLFAAFGAGAFLAFDPSAAGSSTVPLLGEEVRRLLSGEPCWPTQATTGRAKRPEYAKAGSLVVPAGPALAELAASTIAAESLLHADIAARPDTRAIAIAVDSKVFTVGSLVRMRCAGKNAQNLATRIDEAAEASYFFKNFPDALLDLAVQQRFAAALDACRAELTDAHKKDLRASPTTMTAAAGTLASPGTLWVVDQALAGVVPSDQVLHPGLAESRVLAGLCMRFNFSAWVIKTAGRLADGAASDEERDALGSYIRGQPTLSREAWRALRRSPVLQDHRGEWTVPQEMVSRSARGAALLEPALHFPARADEANESLARLQFRRVVRGSDLVALAQLAEQGKVPPAVMGRTASRLQKLLTRSVVTQLKSIRFLDTGQGRLTAPADAYIRSDRLVAALGDNGPYATGMPATLLRRLGCRTEPHADDILTNLAKLRESGLALNRPDAVYRVLVVALRRERRRSGELRDRPVIWTGGRWEAPGDCLVGADNRDAFLDAVTVLPDALRDDWVFLGAHRRPAEAHWVRLLVRAGERYGARQKVPPKVAGALRRAYRNLGSLPETVDPTTCCLLDDRGRLHAPSEAAAGTFLINDEPALASAALAAAVPLAFADTAGGQLTGFLTTSGVRLLSGEATLAGAESGPEAAPDHTLRPDAVLARLHDPNLASAVAALATAVSGAAPSRTAASLTARLARITRITIVKGIQRRYHLAGHEVTVPADWDVGDDQLTLDQVSSTHELRRSVASAVAVLADPERGEQLLGDAVYFLLRCRSAREMQRELARRKIAWQPDLAPDAEDTGETDDEEAASLADAISREIMRPALSPRPAATSPQQAPAASPARPPRPPLPELGLVRPRPAAATGPPQRREPGSGGGGGYGTWAPRSNQETEDDRAVGRRGEEIVLGIERQRVKQLGLDPSCVIWTADSVPGSDHDIKSVDDDGGDLWVEVKATTGRDGQFSWPAAEFQLAIRARRRYVLYRVYEADTTAPSYRPIRDPIGTFDAGELLLDLDSLRGDVGPMGETPSLGTAARAAPDAEDVAGHDIRPSSEPADEQH